MNTPKNKASPLKNKASPLKLSPKKKIKRAKVSGLAKAKIYPHELKGYPGYRFAVRQRRGDGKSYKVYSETGYPIEMQSMRQVHTRMEMRALDRAEVLSLTLTLTCNPTPNLKPKP